MSIFPNGVTSISSYVGKLFETTELRRYLDQIDVLRNEINTKVLPSYQAVIDSDLIFKDKNAFVSEYGKQCNDAIMGVRGLNVSANREFSFIPNNSFQLTYQVMRQMPAILTYLGKGLEKVFKGDVVAKESLTYRQAAFIRLLDMSEFTVMYARRYYIRLMHSEQEKLPNSTKLPEPFTKAELRWMDRHLTTFAQMLRVLATPIKELIVQVDKIPDAIVPSDQESARVVQSTYGDKADPLKLGFIPYVLNPIYLYRTAVLNWRHSRIEAAKEERMLAQLRLQHYQDKLNGQTNPQLEKVIEATQERLKKLNRKIEEMEESYRLDYES